jgi:GcrA cell cycle regulator
MAPIFSPWTDLLVEELKRLWAEGYSATLIAGMLGDGMSRCAVLGKINRLGLERRKPPQQRKPRELTVKRGRPILRRPVFQPSAPPSPPPPPPPCEPEKKPHMRRLQLLQLTDRHCRWPVGDPQRHPFYFCAADRAAGDPYCAFHMGRAFARSRGG